MPYAKLTSFRALKTASLLDQAFAHYEILSFLFPRLSCQIQLTCRFNLTPFTSPTATAEPTVCRAQLFRALPQYVYCDKSYATPRNTSRSKNFSHFAFGVILRP